MFNKFTNKAQEAIINSQIIAQDNGQQNIEALHLLLAMLNQPESLIRPILEKVNIDPEDLEKRIRIELEKLPKEESSSLQSGANQDISAVQGTSEVAMILERSKKEADQMKDEYISNEHILLALVGVRSKAQDI